MCDFKATSGQKSDYALKAEQKCVFVFCNNDWIPSCSRAGSDYLSYELCCLLWWYLRASDQHFTGRRSVLSGGSQKRRDGPLAPSPGIVLSQHFRSLSGLSFRLPPTCGSCWCFVYWFNREAFSIFFCLNDGSVVSVDTVDISCYLSSVVKKKVRNSSRVAGF